MLAEDLHSKPTNSVPHSASSVSCANTAGVLSTSRADPQRILAWWLGRSLTKPGGSGASVEIPARVALALSRLLGALHGATPSSAVANLMFRGQEHSPLHLLSASSAPEPIARALLQAGADIHALAPVPLAAGGQVLVEPAHLAAWSGNARLLRFLLSNGANKDSRDSSGRPLAVLGTLDENPDKWRAVIQVLTRYGVDINSLTADGGSALSLAFKRDNWDQVSSLLDLNASLAGISNHERLAVTQAVSDALMRLAREKRWAELQDRLKLLSKNSQQLSAEFVSRLLNAREGASQPSLLHLIVHYGGSAELVELAARTGADIHARCDINLQVRQDFSAEDKIHSELCRGVCTLHLAAANCSSGVVAKLIELGADPNAFDANGDSAIFYPIKYEPSGAELRKALAPVRGLQDTLEVLRKANVPIDVQDAEQFSLSDICLIKALFHELKFLSDNGARLKQITGGCEELNRAQRTLSNGLVSLASQNEWIKINEVFAALEGIPEFMDMPFVPETLNRVVTTAGSRRSVFLALCQYGAPAELLDKVDELGANLRIEGSQTLPRVLLPALSSVRGATEVFPGTIAEARRVSKIHFAVCSGNEETISWALKHGASLDAFDSFLNFPELYVLIAENPASRIKALKHLRSLGVSAWRSNGQGHNLYELLTAIGDVSTIREMRGWFAETAIRSTSQESRYQATPLGADLDAGDLFVEAARIIHSKEGSSSAAELLRQMRATRNPSIAVAIERGMDEALHPQDGNTGDHFAMLMPAILSGSVSPIVFEELLKALLYSADLRRWTKEHGTHPNLSEIAAAILANEDPAAVSNKLYESAVRVLGEVSGLFDTDRTITSNVGLLFGRLFLEGYQHPVYKHLTRYAGGVDSGKLMPPLFHRMGVTMLPLESRKLPMEPSFVVDGSIGNVAFVEYRKGIDPQKQKLNRDTIIIAGRHCNVISNPDLGTLVISNRSPRFGSRKQMPHPVMYSLGGIGRAFDLDFLLSLSPAALGQHFYSVLSPHVPRRTSDSHRLGAISQLYREMRGFRQFCSSSLFDTQDLTMWHREAKSPKQLVGWEFSRNFPDLVEYLVAMKVEGKALPAMGFMDRDKSIWNLIPFSAPDGAVQHYLQVTEEILDIMQRLAINRVVETIELERSGMKAFAEAGKEAEGLFVLLDP